MLLFELYFKRKIYDEKHTKFSFPKSWRHNEILLLKHPFGFFMGMLTKCSKYLWKGGINLDPRNRHPSHTLSVALGLDTNNPTNKRRPEVSEHRVNSEQIQGAFPGIVRRNRGFRSPNGTHESDMLHCQMSLLFFNSHYLFPTKN